MEKLINIAADKIINSKHTTVFTGAGISVESGIPPFRGKNGLWNKYNPEFLDISYFYKNPLNSWVTIKEIFYDYFGKALPNKAHECVAQLEKLGYVKAIITQNIDNLHTNAGSKIVYEFHGNSRKLVCLECNSVFAVETINLNILPPKCKKCNGLLKPDFIFFGEDIPSFAYQKSVEEANIADVFLIIGTTGEVMPACNIPIIAKKNGAFIIEINLEISAYTHSITDIFLKGTAVEVIGKLFDIIVNK